MSIIRQQMARIYHFLALLFLLFGVNIVFNLRYDWGGVSAIVRSYIFVLAFYCVFIFSQLDYDRLIDDYREKFGRFARLKLFFDIRLFPFIFAVILNILFLIINSDVKASSVSSSLLKVLDGRYSNMIFYSLILFFVLRQNRRPGIAIPVFIFGSVLFFIADRFIYSVVPPGKGIGLVKLLKYMIFIYILAYDFARRRYRIVKLILLSVAGGIVLFMSVAAIYYGVYLYAGERSIAGSRSLRAMLKAGFISQLPKLEQMTLKSESGEELSELVSYSSRYGYSISFDKETWGRIIVKQRMTVANQTFRYLYRNSIRLDFDILRAYAEKQSMAERIEFLASEDFKKYFSGYFELHGGGFIAMFSAGNDAMKIWIIDCLAYADNPDSITFLIRFLTSVDSNISRHAYSALKNITETDPASALHRDIYDLEVVNAFIKYRNDRIRQNR